MEAYVKASEHDLDSLICTSLKAETNWLQSCKYDNPVTSSSLSTRETFKLVLSNLVFGLVMYLV